MGYASRPMNKVSIVFLTALALGLGSGCTKAGDEPAKTAALEQKVADLNARVQKLEGFLSPHMNRPEEKEPDPAVVYSVDVAGSPSVGPATAKVTLVEAFDYACPYCYKVTPTIAELRKIYGDDLRVVWKFLIVHDEAVAPSLAACAADRQGKFPQMEKIIWDEGFAKRDLSPERLETLAGQVGLDVAKWKADVAGEACMERLKKDTELMGRLAVHGTPGFFVNGRFLGGAQPIEAFKVLIDEELAKATKAIAGGTPAEAYYDITVVKAGKKDV